MLYTSETPEAAIAERRFHLYQGQPFRPSRVRHELYELTVSLEALMRFPDLDALSSIGFDTAHYGQLSYLERGKEYPPLPGGRRGLRVPGRRRTVGSESSPRGVTQMVRNHRAVDFS